MDVRSARHRNLLHAKQWAGGGGAVHGCRRLPYTENQRVSDQQVLHVSGVQQFRALCPRGVASGMCPAAETRLSMHVCPGGQGCLGVTQHRPRPLNPVVGCPEEAVSQKRTGTVHRSMHPLSSLRAISNLRRSLHPDLGRQCPLRCTAVHLIVGSRFHHGNGRVRGRQQPWEALHSAAEHQQAICKIPNHDIRQACAHAPGRNTWATRRCTKHTDLINPQTPGGVSLAVDSCGRGTA